MSSSKMPGVSWNKPKDSSGTDGEVDSLRSPHGKKNIEPSIQPTVHQTSTTGKSQKMDWEPTAALSKSPPAYVSSPSSVGNKLGNLKIEDVRKITTDLFKTKLSSDQSCLKPSYSNLLSPEENKDVFMRPASVTMTKTHTSLSIAGPSGSKTPIQNPLMNTQPDHGSSTTGQTSSKAAKQNLLSQTKTHRGSSNTEASGSKAQKQNTSIKMKTDHGPSTAEPSQSKPSALKPLEFPLTKRKIAETFEIADACRFFLNFMKSKRTDLNYKEGEIDNCTTDIQKALRDAEQICFKLEAEPETLPEEMSAAVTQSQKLAYLLSISYRSFKKLDELGSKLQEQLQAYTNESEMFHVSADRLLEYIVETILEKCMQLENF